MIRGAVFDLDGTITDSNPFWDRAPVVFLESLGIEAEPELGRIIFSMTVPEAVEYMIKRYSLLLTPGEFSEGMRRIMGHFYAKEVGLKPGITDILKLLKAKGIAMAIATVTERELAEKALDRHGIADFFEDIVTADDAGAGKQEPAIYLMAAEKTGSCPEETLVFEDALHALRTAKDAGFVTVGVFDEASREVQDELRHTAGLYLPDYMDLSGLTAVL